jgi:hypothetical protein
LHVVVYDLSTPLYVVWLAPSLCHWKYLGQRSFTFSLRTYAWRRIMKIALLFALGLLLGTAAFEGSKGIPFSRIHTNSNPVPLCPPDNPNCGLN